MQSKIPTEDEIAKYLQGQKLKTVNTNKGDFNSCKNILSVNKKS